MNSVWQDKSQIDKFTTLNGEVKTDVLVIGGGIAGVLTAYFLHQWGVPYFLVEKERICGKTTANTTAKITFQHSLVYHKLLKSMGEEKAKMYFAANKAAFDEYALLCKNIDCDYEIKDNYVYSQCSRQKLEDEISAVSKIGYTAQLVEKLPLPVCTVGAVKFENQAQFNPLKFIAGISKGLNIYENTFVREIEDNTAVTDKGKIRAKKIIVTTHFPFINKHGLYFLKLYQHRSYVIALENAENVNGMYVDESQKGMSFRNYENLLLLGGGAHRTGKNGGCWEELRVFAKTNFPQAREKYHWATQDCMSLDGVPYIGKYSKSTNNLYVAAGFNKWGMTSSMAAARILADLCTEGHNEYAEVFCPSRSILKPQLFVNAFEATANMLTFSKKRCPHLGCALKFNRAEKSWDCACHGSRFDENGKVIDNPANGNLQK